MFPILEILPYFWIYIAYLRVKLTCGSVTAQISAAVPNISEVRVIDEETGPTLSTLHSHRSVGCSNPIFLFISFKQIN